MPVTVLLQQHEPKVHTGIKGVGSLDAFLAQCCYRDYPGPDRCIQASSLTPSDLYGQGIHPSSSGLVRSAIEAWGQHSHLVLRPDDFWTQILVQLNFYMTKNGESLRDLFVSHAGRQSIVIASETNWEDILACLQVALQERVKTPWLSEWIQGGFSTSTPADELSYIVLMMGMMSSYFTYSADNTCGIPSITLLGTQQDWQRLANKIERLGDFGDEPEAYRERLRPILTRIVSTFDDPSTVEIRDFWDQMVHAKVKHDSTCGRPALQYTVSGWLLSLFYWKISGAVNERFAQGLGHTGKPGPLSFDGVRYGEAFLEELPVGYAKVRCMPLSASGVKGSKERDRWLVAGNVAKRIVDGAPQGYTAAIAKESRSPSLSTISNEKRMMRKRVANKGVKISFPNLLCGLSRFGSASSDRRRQNTLAPRASRENMAPLASKKIPVRKAGHSTIQPVAVWFLFSAKELRGHEEEDEETWGPTVDAIESCSHVEHYRMINR